MNVSHSPPKEAVERKAQSHPNQGPGQGFFDARVMRALLFQDDKVNKQGDDDDGSEDRPQPRRCNSVQKTLLSAKYSKIETRRKVLRNATGVAPCGPGEPFGLAVLTGYRSNLALRATPLSSRWIGRAVCKAPAGAGLFLNALRSLLLQLRTPGQPHPSSIVFFDLEPTYQLLLHRRRHGLVVRQLDGVAPLALCHGVQAGLVARQL